VSYRLPPLNGLRAFEAAARHLSFKLAAEELSVTPGAVGQQVKHLEQSLGVPLFRRLHRGLLLTGQGEALLPAASEAFERLSAACDGLARSLPGRTLRLGLSPRLAADPAGLLARIAAPGEPSDDLRITASEDLADLLNGVLDALLRPPGGAHPGLHGESLRLHEAFAPHREGLLVTWPGLARCREMEKARRLLSQA